MSISVTLVAGPAAEPITLLQAKAQCNVDADYTGDDALIGALITAARQDCENYTRQAFLTQRWVLRMMGFPGSDWHYNWNGYPAIRIPKPPFQSIEFVRYIDTFGAVQDLPLDTTYGNGGLQYGYQLFRGDDGLPACIYSSWARPWPPTRMVPANVIVQFRAGYGGPLTCSLGQGSKALAVTSGVPVTFNPDDAPLLTGDTGTAVSIPGAGSAGAALASFIAAVDSNGNATLADAAATAVTGASAWLGLPVPLPICQAVLLLVDFYYEHRGEADIPMPQVVRTLLDPYRNLVV